MLRGRRFRAFSQGERAGPGRAGWAAACLLAGLLAGAQVLSAAPAAEATGAASQRKVLIMGRGDPFREPDNIPTHPQMAKATFLKLARNPQNDPAKGWTADLSWDLMLRLGMDPTNTPPETLFNYLGRHQLGYRVVIQNFAAGALDRYWGSAVDNGLMPFAPHYNNTPNLYVPDSVGLKSAVAVGGGVGQNYYSHGPGLEFYDALPLWASANGFEDAAESWANQTLAIKFAHILDAHPAYNLWDAREHLRQAGSAWSKGWTEKQGYGRVDERAVVGKLLPGPPVEFLAAAPNRHTVLFSWRNFLMTDFAATVIARPDGHILYDGAGTNFVWPSDVDGDATFTYWSRNQAGERSRLESYQTVTVKDLLSRASPTCLVLGPTPSWPGLGDILRLTFSQAAPDWICDRVARPTASNGRALKSPSATDVVATLPDFHAMVGYALSHHYRLLIAPVSYEEEDDLFQFKADWDRATAGGALVVLGHYFQVPGQTNADERLPVPPRLYSAVTVGIAGLANARSVGPGLEFSDTAPPHTFVLRQAFPSVAAAKVAGKLARILQAHPAYNLWDARQHLRQSSSHYAAGWSEDGGFGRPPEEPAKIASLDPAPPLDLQVSKSADGRSVTFSWLNFQQTSFAETVIQRGDGRLIYHGTGNRFVWPSDVDGGEAFRFFSRNKSGQLSRAETYTVFPVTGLVRN